MITKLVTAREIGPAYHGRRMSYEQFATAPWREGYRYELIDGRVYVSPLPNLRHDDVLEWLREALDRYKRGRPDVINRISTHGRVFVPDRPAETCPEPDLVAYHDFPYHVPSRERKWEDVSPILVVEIASDDLAKDFGRNVDLYEQVPSIREYWLVHAGDFNFELLFRVYRRRGKKWQKPIDHKFDEVYTTGLLPGFKLRIKPDA